jgi:hypothetical protein
MPILARLAGKVVFQPARLGVFPRDDLHPASVSRGVARVNRLWRTYANIYSPAQRASSIISPQKTLPQFVVIRESYMESVMPDVSDFGAIPVPPIPDEFAIHYAQCKFDRYLTGLAMADLAVSQSRWRGYKRRGAPESLFKIRNAVALAALLEMTCHLNAVLRDKPYLNSHPEIDKIGRDITRAWMCFNTFRHAPCKVNKDKFRPIKKLAIELVPSDLRLAAEELLRCDGMRFKW